MYGEYDSKNEEIGQIIEELFKVESEEDFESICKMFDNIYLDEEGNIQENFRHEYTNISGKIRELIECEVDGIKPFILQNLLDNIGYIYDYAVEHEKKYVKNLFKLKDHIGLEAGRIELVEKLRWEIINSKESISIQLEDLHGIADSLDNQLSDSMDLIREAKYQSDEVKRQSQQSEDKLQELNKTSDEVVKKMEDVQRDSITILGIFASIVLSFTAGMGFSSSVLENFHEGSPYRVMAIVIALGVVVLNMISVLLLYIDKIKTVGQKEIEYPTFLLVLDIIAGILLIVDFIAFKFNWFS